ncbi:MAG TPA: HAMP domain-containing sensor histidine kinase, partial [Candidatus Anoxymicrobiaceae bacterium]
WVFNDRSGEPEGAWAMVRNLSERIQYENFMRETIIRLEQANDRLQELDRLKTELVAMVSHELRAPLGAIESSLNAMRVLKDGSSPEEQEELIRILDRGVRRLSRLIDDLMDITRIESGQLKLEPRLVDAADLAGRVVTSFEGLFADKGIDIAFERPAGACMALCDPGRIEQVLTNLIANALKFTDDGGVVVSIDSTPGDTIFCVADSGPGLPSELHQKVFEKFFSLDSSSTDGKQGVGLGLAISKGIVEAHDGHIWVESGTGAGAKFCFEIPGDPDS